MCSRNRNRQVNRYTAPAEGSKEVEAQLLQKQEKVNMGVGPGGREVQVVQLQPEDRRVWCGRLFPSPPVLEECGVTTIVIAVHARNRQCTRAVCGGHVCARFRGHDGGGGGQTLTSVDTSVGRGCSTQIAGVSCFEVGVIGGDRAAAGFVSRLEGSNGGWRRGLSWSVVSDGEDSGCSCRTCRRDPQPDRESGRDHEGQAFPRRQRLLLQRVVDAPDCITTSEAIFQLCAAIGCGVVPRATPRWWMKLRTGATWEDLRFYDDANEDYFREKLRMPRRVFMEISEACAPHLQRQVTFYREPLQPEQIDAYALYRWATGETYDSSTSSFGAGRASGIIAVRDVASVLLRVYADKILWPIGVWKHVVLRAFMEKGFPNCHGAVDCTHIYVDKQVNEPSENYFDCKHRFSVVAQVVVDLDLPVLDIFVGYPGSCHDIKIIQLSSLSRCAEEETLFRRPPMTMSGGVRTNGYILGDKGYPLSEWVVVPYGGINQHPDEERFDTKQVAKGVVERAFGRLKGMWRLFLRTHKTNLDTLPQQFTAVCILHNILLDAGIEFDENLLWEVDRNGVRQHVDLGIQLPPQASEQCHFNGQGARAPRRFGGANETLVIHNVAIIGKSLSCYFVFANCRQLFSIAPPSISLTL
ncbi:hypothetical protein CBR_g36633 [Chara braunii]|uniref:DDE Tnp4 domain-containing protein n=1 Tax=Chara braunii TaxID=69332 RepID=A0A388LL31_CHABU|nr:hypothetical protein CBR_g36633 [Chara braunii]|eukprot:GBG83014.1 hypothetical protein CBR_g36633 [Chara braunii]